MEYTQNTRFTAKKQMEAKTRWLLIGMEILLALSVIAGIVWGQFLIPLGCAFVLGAILLLSMRLSYGSAAMNAVAYTMLIVMLIVGAGLLYKGLSAGVKRQDDRQYTQSLGISAEELLAITDSEGTQYAVVRDGDISRHLLPEAYQAKRVEDIGAVVIIKTTYNKVGSYSNGGKAYRPELTLSLKSLKTGEIISELTLYGDEPPTHVRISPLDPNKDRYGDLPSDKTISTNCVSMIERAQSEEQRKSRVTILSEAELLDFVHRMITQTADADGWASLSDVQDAIKAADPDFSFSDYDCPGLWQYCSSDPHFAVKELDYSDPTTILSPHNFVRWAGQ